ncbi:DUF6191 domain-containing protein [Jatrophihabitans sp.]|jgi:hypothetical protein|uniref:DUF6191 domain-containing protein n=1 Tax=Jatrophihabitans sp. TaxID=1932789 RepID=UPI002EF9A296
MTEWGIDTLFNPGKRHMDEEKRRLQSTREEVGDSSGGRRIDLESGTVTISRRPKDRPAAADEDAEAADADETAGTEAADTENAPEANGAEETAADEAAAEADRSAAAE